MELWNDLKELARLPSQNRREYYLLHNATNQPLWLSVADYLILVGICSLLIPAYPLCKLGDWEAGWYAH